MDNENKDRLKEKILSVALNSNELFDEMNDAVKEIKTIATDNATEATISGAFERIMYSILKDIGIAFHPEKEVTVSYHLHIGKGRLDSRIGAVVIEYKRPATLRTEKQIGEAKLQLTNYIKTISINNKNEVFGLLTDGRNYIEIIVDNGQIISQTQLFPIDGSVLVRLTKNISMLFLEKLSAETFIKELTGKNLDGAVFKIARTLFNTLKTNETPRTKMLESEWEEIFRLGHNDKSQQKRIIDRQNALSELFKTSLSSVNDEYLSLFALHTAYAIVIKIIAYKIVSEVHLQKQLINWNDLVVSESDPLQSFCANLEDGEIFRDLGILNLLEGDFFSWYSDKGQWNQDIYSEIVALLHTLGKYEQTAGLFTSTSTVDLFRVIYESTIPQPVRSSFGEFYTPRWLAESVIEESIHNENWTLLDPCSGSGTFLISAIDKIRVENQHLNSEDLLSNILSRVCGIDLNPIAVLTSRVNYFIRIADLIPNLINSIVIPVYLGDSTNIPSRIFIDGKECVTFNLNTLQSPINVTLPLSLVSDIPRFTEIMLNYENAIKSKDFDSSFNLIYKNIDISDKTQKVIENIISLTNQLISLEKNNWNGIWARIITNFLSTAALSKFDAIVGNPPWIDWKNLPKGYRERIKSLCIDKGLFSGDGRTGGINLNICALISYVCINNWLRADGKLVFLMPKELIFQQSYQGWRRIINSPNHNFEKFYDWSYAGYPFDPVKEDFLTYIIGNDECNRPEFVVWNKKKDGSIIKDWVNWSEAKCHLEKENMLSGQIIPNSSAFTIAKNKEELDQFQLITGESVYKGREGIEFYPQELLLFEFDSNGPSKETVYLQNVKFPKSKYPIYQKKYLFETNYFYPLVKGSYIKPFSYDDPDFIVPFPYEISDPIRPIPSQILQNKSKLLFKYYLQNESIIRSQTEFSDKIRGKDAGDFYGLARTGPYTFANLHVAFRDNTNWCGVVLGDKIMPWNERKKFLFQNHAVSMCERPDGTHISLDEAHYICAIINAPIVKRFIDASSDNRSFKIRPPIYIPLFDNLNNYHKTLSKLSLQAHMDPENYKNYLHSINEIYLSLCEQRNLK